MCTTLASSASSSLGTNLKECNESIEDSILNLDNMINKQKEKEKEEDYFKESNSDFHEMILEKSKDGRFAKVYNVIIYKII
jgi:DNA-binding GntR family transcriptional regulator